VAALAGLVALAGPASPQDPSSRGPSDPGAASSVEDAPARATRAREAVRLDEAASLYREAVGVRPDWAGGWRFLGSMAYERDRHEECRKTFERLVELDPQIGPGALQARRSAGKLE